ncbi:MAG: hypothetical protein QXE01_04400 [Sulfolobales archaeon]
MEDRNIVSPKTEECEDIEIAGKGIDDVGEERICVESASRSSIRLEDQRMFGAFIDDAVSN